MFLRHIRNPKVRIAISWTCFIAGAVLWPVSMFTFAKEESPVTLSLSWFAIVLEGYNGVQISEDSKQA